jgi:hypothetical protein
VANRSWPAVSINLIVSVVTGGPSSITGIRRMSTPIVDMHCQGEGGMKL